MCQKIVLWQLGKTLTGLTVRGSSRPLLASLSTRAKVSRVNAVSSSILRAIFLLVSVSETELVGLLDTVLILFYTHPHKLIQLKSDSKINVEIV